MSEVCKGAQHNEADSTLGDIVLTPISICPQCGKFEDCKYENNDICECSWFNGVD